MAKRLLRWCLLCSAWLLCMTVMATPPTTGVGFAQLSLTDPTSGKSMPGMIFYPSSAAPGQTVLGPYTVAAIRR